MSPSDYSSADQTPSWVNRFNLSQWALDHQAFTRYLMIVLMLLGVAAYFQLGQDEDPPFTFRAMVVRAYWPGATAEQVAEQVADRIEKETTVSGRFVKKVLLDERNIGMADKLFNLLGKERNTVAAIGTLHLLGSNSVPALLSARGATVERVY